jgi:hypothetical protein
MRREYTGYDDRVVYLMKQNNITREEAQALLDELGDENVINYNEIYTDENIFLERDFKLKVLDWLNDGRPKLFKSPYEGNYIVRLLNNSLSPVKELGRLMHTY